MAALSYAQRTGIGQHVDLAMINAMFFTDDYAHFQLEGANVLGGGGQVFDATGGQIMLAGDEKWYWRVLNTRAGVEDPTPEGADLDTKIALRREAIQAFLLSFPDRASLLAKLDEVNLAWGDVHDHREVFDRQGSIEGRQILTDGRRPGRRRAAHHQHAVQVLRRPRPASAARPPYRGEHNYEAVADWLGDGCPDLDGLHDSGVLLQDDHARRLTKDR